jgi:hypothetical protein
MQKLAFLVGSWEIEIEGLDRAGKVIHISREHLETTSELGGQLVLSLGYSDARTPAQRNWKFCHRAKQKLYDVNFDLVGNFEVREQVGAGALAFALVGPFRGTDGVPRNWRRTDRPVSADAGRWRTQALKPGTTEPAPGTGESVFEWTLGGVWLGETLTMEPPAWARATSSA